MKIYQHKYKDRHKYKYKEMENIPFEEKPLSFVKNQYFTIEHM